MNFGSGYGLKRRGSCVLFCMGSGLGEEGLDRNGCACFGRTGGTRVQSTGYGGFIEAATTYSFFPLRICLGLHLGSGKQIDDWNIL